MLVVDADRITTNFLGDAEKTNFKNSSYYLEIGSIIPTGTELEDFDPSDPPTKHVIKPGEMARVISKEKFQIHDHGITALVTLRSSMTKQGLLPLDVGIVDSSYEGPIGSIVINFSKNDIPLQKGMEFFRVLFIGHDDVETQYRHAREKFTHEEYIRERYTETVRDFPELFVQSDVVVDRLEGDVIDTLTTRMLKKYWWKIALFILAIGGLIVGGLTLIVAEYFPSFSEGEIKALIQAYVAGGSSK